MPERPWWLLVVLIVAGFALGAVVLIALHFRQPPAICGPELQAFGPACCVPGQHLEQGRCVGEVVSCPSSMFRVQQPTPGCVKESHVVEFAGGMLSIGPLDWEAEGRLEPRQTRVKPYSLDSLEVTVHRWHACVQAKSCTALPDAPSPGHPATGVAPSMAEHFCLFVGGRLPTSDEWVYAATGSPARRYPWGNTGLVCRRAAFGLVNGPCASGAIAPALAGSRPAGRTPEGLWDMVGNVAEWTRHDKFFVAHGGSFRSTVAHELKSWSSETADRASPHIGFRCAYDPPS